MNPRISRVVESAAASTALLLILLAPVKMRWPEVAGWIMLTMWLPTTFAFWKSDMMRDGLREPEEHDDTQEGPTP